MVGVTGNEMSDHKKLISVPQAAKRLGIHKATVFKVLKRLRIKAEKARSSEGHGQLTSYITESELEAVRESLAASPQSVVESDSSLWGVFYLLQLEPQLDPGRFKLGYAASIDDRLRSHRTVAPLAKLIETWPCKLLWEKTAIESISRGYERLYTEVFRAPSIDEVVARVEEFFNVMPALKSNRRDV